MKRFLKIMMVSLLAVGLAASFSFAANMGKFEVKNAEGKPVKSEDLFKEKNTMLILAQTACSQCVLELTELSDLYNDMKAKGNVYVVLVDVGSDRALASYKSKGYPFPVLLDPEFKIGDAAGINATPSTLVVKKGGDIIYSTTGYRLGKGSELVDKM